MSAERFPFCEGIGHYDRQSDDDWRINDTPLRDYGGASSGHTHLLEGLLGRLRAQPKGAVMDVAGGRNGIAAREILSEGLATRALFTNLSDRRSFGLRLKQPFIRLDQVIGDLLDPMTWQEIADWRNEHAPEGFRGVMYQPGGALQDLSDSFYIGAANQLIDWTAPGGALLLQGRSSMTLESKNAIVERPDIALVQKNTASNDVLLVKVA